MCAWRPILATAALWAVFSPSSLASDRNPSVAPCSLNSVPVSVDGSKHPELIPQETRWEVAFESVSGFARGEERQVSPQRVEALSKYTLHVPVSDVYTIVEVADLTMKRIEELRGPLDREHDSGVALDWSLEERQSRYEASCHAALEGRDLLAARLSERSFRAFVRWVDLVARSIKLAGPPAKE